MGFYYEESGNVKLTIFIAKTTTNYNCAPQLLNASNFTALTTNVSLNCIENAIVINFRDERGMFQNDSSFDWSFHAERKRERAPKPVTSGLSEQYDWFKPGKAVQTGGGVRSKFRAVFRQGRVIVYS